MEKLHFVEFCFLFFVVDVLFWMLINKLMRESIANAFFLNALKRSFALGWWNVHLAIIAESLIVVTAVLTLYILRLLILKRKDDLSYLYLICA